MDLTPTDFLSGLGGLGNLPDPFREGQEVTQANQQNRAGEQQLALGALKLNALQQQQAQERQYQQDVADALKTGNFAGLYAKYPDQQKALQASHDALNEPAKRSQERDLFAVSSFIKNGATDSAKQLLQRRIDADRAAGQDPSDDQQMLDALNNGDPAHVKAAADMALYAILPEDKRAEVSASRTRAKSSRTPRRAISTTRQRAKSCNRPALSRKSIRSRCSTRTATSSGRAGSRMLRPAASPANRSSNWR